MRTCSASTRTLAIPLLLSISAAASANTAIETETAQIGKRGEIGTSNSVEVEKASDALNIGTLTQFEYGISDRSELLIEPFFYQATRLIGGSFTHGGGDLEITPSYEIIQEDKGVPAVLLACKLKVPLAPAPDFGSGKFDYYPYVILGEHLGGFTFNGNLGVNFVTPEVKGDKFTETVVADLEVERDFGANKHWTGFLEAFSAEDAVFTGSGAIQYNLNEHTHFFTAASYDVEGSVVVRPGVNFDFF